MVQRRDRIVEDNAGLAVNGRERDAAVLAFAEDGPGVRRRLVDQADFETRDPALRICLFEFDRQSAEIEMFNLLREASAELTVKARYFKGAGHWN